MLQGKEEVQQQLQAAQQQAEQLQQQLQEQQQQAAERLQALEEVLTLLNDKTLCIASQCPALSWSGVNLLTAVS